MHPTRIFKHPDELEAAWKAYKENLEIQAHDWLKVQYVGKDGDRKTDPQKVPYTLEGFKRFLRENYGDCHAYFVNAGNLYDDFVTICSRIKEEIRENQIIGGLLGFFNTSITQRLNNLVEKSQVDVKTEQPLFPETTHSPKAPEG